MELATVMLDITDEAEMQHDCKALAAGR